MRGRQRLLVNLDLVNEEPTVTVGESGSSGDFRGSGDGLGGEEGDNRGFGEIFLEPTYFPSLDAAKTFLDFEFSLI
ncbi:hypothetical protein U1Q18_041495 [Sarracenia purpurea var. burkii]